MSNNPSAFKPYFNSHTAQKQTSFDTEPHLKRLGGKYLDYWSKVKDIYRTKTLPICKQVFFQFVSSQDPEMC